MSVARVTEISSSSKKSFDHAIKKGVKRASASLRNVTGAWVADQEVTCKNGEITSYQVRMKVTFILDD
jgi:flavin-binding protein dodecin